MNKTTLVGIFDSKEEAQAASRELATLGIAESDVSVAQNTHSSGYETYRGGRSESSEESGIGGFFSRLFGSDVDDDERGFYSEAVRRGSTVVTADVDEDLVDRASEVFNRHGAVDIDRREAQYRASGYEGFVDTAPPYTLDQTRSELEQFGRQGEVALPVIEEQMRVGKRTVQRGGVRVVTRVSERPQEEHVTLREERVRVDRRPVDREVSASEVAGMKDGVIEVSQTSEEAVVSKQARVVEEVVVNKDVVEREETVRDTVRRTDVEVEDTVGDRSTTGRAMNR